jgi:hypothetical protein
MHPHERLFTAIRLLLSQPPARWQPFHQRLVLRAHLGAIPTVDQVQVECGGVVGSARGEPLTSRTTAKT